METILDFKNRVSAVLDDIGEDVLSYNKDEFWMIRAPYEFLEYHAENYRLFNTAIALRLARGLHDGAHRKTPVIRKGVAHKPPYVLHCLTVCKMLADMWLPLSLEEMDILFAAALCHDMIEDVNFANGGKELVTQYHLDPRVYEIVKTVSKRKDFTLEEEKAFFHKIEENKLALLIKLSDRGHNVTDLYNMSEAKIQEYVGETRRYFLPMCEYARQHYPELDDVIELMQDQLVCLTKTAEEITLRYATEYKKLENELEQLYQENAALRMEYAKLHEGEV